LTTPASSSGGRADPLALNPRARGDLDRVEIDDETVVYDPTTGEVHYLNATAALVFELCDGSGSVQEIAGDLAEAFGLPDDEVVEQVESLVAALREAGLLAGSVRLRASPSASEHGSEPVGGAEGG
jgi:PqqD family protein of HPr-rel-A system